MDILEKKLLLEIISHVIKERPQVADSLRAILCGTESSSTELEDWKSRGYAPPSPTVVKLQCLLRYAPINCTWIETGTYLGTTTEQLAARGNRVITIEPEPRLFEAAAQKLLAYPNVTVLHGTSETCLDHAISTITGNVAFWLDGHYSEGVTYQGENDTPIIFELDTIASNLPKLDQVAVLIDDVRCFRSLKSGYSNYPAITELIDWATAHRFDWRIEHDIFCATRG